MIERRRTINRFGVGLLISKDWRGKVDLDRGPCSNGNDLGKLDAFFDRCRKKSYGHHAAGGLAGLDARTVLLSLLGLPLHHAAMLRQVAIVACSC